MDCSGDVNGDGCDDIVLGSYGNDEGGSTAGKVYLFFGRDGGWDGDMNLSDADASFIGEGANDRAGIAVTNSGDINGDGFDDIVIGADEYEPMGGERGRAYIILGRTGPWYQDRDLSTADVRIWGEYDENEFGRSVSTGGDINGDGYDDLRIGAPRFEATSTNYSGKSYLILGGPRLSGFIYASSGVDASFIGAGDDEYCGWDGSISGDVNGDGLDDMLIGARNYKINSNYKGRTYLLLGSRTGWSRDVTLTSADATFIGVGSFSGWTVSIAGDLDSDGFDDIAISDPEYLGGRVYIVLGTEDGWKRDLSLGDADASFKAESGSNRAGYSLTGAGDVNGDGLDDLIIGAPDNRQGGYISPYGAGKTYIMFGKTSGWEKDVSLADLDVSFYGEVGDDSAGYSVAGGGDVDNDGRPDIMIGAWNADHYGLNTGSNYLIRHSVYDEVVNLSSEYRMGSSGIYISWDDTVEAPGFYGIYRGTYGGDLVRLASSNVNNYTDWDISLGLTYTYYIVGVDPFGTESPLSDPIYVLADRDTDRDGIGDLMDWDDDGDGVPDGEDDFPLDPTESLDSDLDGTGNNADTDDDNDGIPDTSDPAPLSPSVSVDLSDLYGRLAAMEANLTAGLVSFTGDIEGYFDELLDHMVSALQGLNQTLRAHISQSVGQVMSRLDTLQVSIDSQIDAFWSDFNTTEQERAQYLSDMNDALLIALSDLETSLTQRIDGISGSGSVIDRIDALESRYNISVESLRTLMGDGFDSVEALLSGEMSDLEAYIALSIVQLRNDIELVNLSIHMHLEELAEMIGGLLDEDIADLQVYIDGEMTTVQEYLKEQIIALGGDVDEGDEAIRQLIMGLGPGTSGENLSAVIHRIEAVQTSIDQMGDLTQMTTNIEGIGTAVQDGQEDDQKRDDGIRVLLFVLIALAVVIVLLMIVNIVILRTRTKGSNEQ